MTNSNPPPELGELCSAALRLQSVRESQAAASSAEWIEGPNVTAILDLYILNLLPSEAEGMVEEALLTSRSLRDKLAARPALQEAAGPAVVDWGRVGELLALEQWRRVLAPLLLGSILVHVRRTGRQAVAGRVRRSGGEGTVPIFDSSGETLGDAQVHLPRPVCDARGRCRVSLLLPERLQKQADEGEAVLRLQLGEGSLEVPLEIRPYGPEGEFTRLATASLQFHEDRRDYELNLAQSRVVLGAGTATR